MKRVVVTGIGVLTNAGTNKEDFWRNLIQKGADMPEEELKLTFPPLFSPALTRRMDRFSLMTLTASKMALEDSGLDMSQADVERIGTVFTSCYGSLASNYSFGHKLLTAGPNMTSPTVFASTVANACIGHTCINLGLKGASTMLMGSSAIGCGYDILRADRADGLLAGGMEEYHEKVVTSFEQMGYLSQQTNGPVLARPLDKHRDGITLREGAAVLMLETLDHAEKRGAKILAEIIGFGGAFSPVSPEHATEPIDCEPFAWSMQAALDDAGVTPDQIDAVHLSANGAKYGDLAEIEALHKVFGTRAATVPVTSIKGLIGETIGSSASIGIAAAVLQLVHQTMPPTVGFESLDDGIELNVVTEATAQTCNTILVNGYDVGGNIASLVLRRYES
jgi:3-oxoacyl-[acyl-carrier-protein] synthase II